MGPRRGYRSAPVRPGGTTSGAACPRRRVLGLPNLPGRRPRRRGRGRRRRMRGTGDGRAVRSRGQRRQRPLQVLDVGAPFVQARQEMTGLGLGKLAGTSFVGERQGALMAQPFQLGPQSRRRLVGSRSLRGGGLCRVADDLLLIRGSGDVEAEPGRRAGPPRG